MTLIELLRRLEARLGGHQMPLNPAAKDIKTVFESIPLHQDFMKRLVQSIYTGNGCKRLSDPVDREITFEALAPLRLEVLRCARTDVDLYRLIDDVCIALDEIFGRTAPIAVGPKVALRAQIIHLAPFRRRRLKSLA
jgi:hypothetical protein